MSIIFVSFFSCSSGSQGSAIASGSSPHLVHRGGQLLQPGPLQALPHTPHDQVELCQGRRFRSNYLFSTTIFQGNPTRRPTTLEDKSQVRFRAHFFSWQQMLLQCNCNLSSQREGEKDSEDIIEIETVLVCSDGEDTLKGD